MVIWYWLGFTRTHRSSSLLFHGTEWRFVLPGVSWPCAICIICCYGFTPSLCPASVMGLMTQAPQCALCDKAIISHGPADWDKTYLSLCWCSWISLYFFLLSGFLFWVSRCEMGPLVINASVTEGEREEENSHSPRCWKLLLLLHLWKHEVAHKYVLIQTYSSYIHAHFCRCWSRQQFPGSGEVTLPSMTSWCSTIPAVSATSDCDYTRCCTREAFSGLMWGKCILIWHED